MNVNKKVKKNWSKEDIIILAWLIDKYGKNPDDYVHKNLKSGAKGLGGCCTTHPRKGLRTVDVQVDEPPQHSKISTKTGLAGLRRIST